MCFHLPNSLENTKTHSMKYSCVTNEHAPFTTHIYMQHITYVSLLCSARLLHWVWSFCWPHESSIKCGLSYELQKLHVQLITLQDRQMHRTETESAAAPVFVKRTATSRCEVMSHRLLSWCRLRVFQVFSFLSLKTNTTIAALLWWCRCVAVPDACSCCDWREVIYLLMVSHVSLYWHMLVFCASAR